MPAQPPRSPQARNDRRVRAVDVAQRFHKDLFGPTTGKGMDRALEAWEALDTPSQLHALGHLLFLQIVQREQHHRELMNAIDDLAVQVEAMATAGDEDEEQRRPGPELRVVSPDEGEAEGQADEEQLELDAGDDDETAEEEADFLGLGPPQDDGAGQ